MLCKRKIFLVVVMCDGVRHFFFSSVILFILVLLFVFFFLSLLFVMEVPLYVCMSVCMFESSHVFKYALVEICIWKCICVNEIVAKKDHWFGKML